MNTIGLDAGSVSVKVVVLDRAGSVVQRHYRKHEGHPLPVALELLREAAREGDSTIAVTGSAGKLIAEILRVTPVNELAAQAYATRKLYPQIQTIIEMGGEDSKLILLGEKGMRDFAMNSVCAAGTGSFLDQQAERLRLTIGEFGDLALRSPKPPRIAGRCSVFAKSDMIHLQQIATPVEEIVAGLCFAVARNFKGSIARGRKITAPTSFQGGVAANQGMVRAFREVLELEELFVPPDFALMGALGAAMKAKDDGTAAAYRIENILEHLSRDKEPAVGHPPLIVAGDGFQERHLLESRAVQAPSSAKLPLTAYMGIDIGSISTNVAVIDVNGGLLSKRYLMTAGRPIEAVRQGLEETFAELGERVIIAGVGTTGSGRYMIADYVGADIVKNEITAQATAAAFIDPTVDTIFEIGGQDSKYIALENGVIVDFEMNKACAAGTGSFLEEQAEKLNVSVKSEFAECAFASSRPVRLGERCTVFMENSLMANLQRGASKNDLFAGLAYSIVQNYINRVVAGRKIGRNIFFQGGVAFNKSVVAAFEKHLGVTITVPPNHDVTGAIGMALIAMRSMLAKGAGAKTAFKGFDWVQRPYEISSFGCNGCSNLCEINRVKVEGETRPLFYGGRCEKYDIDRKDRNHIPDLFQFRDKLLWQSVENHAKKHANNGRGHRRGRIGIPYVFFFTEQLPYWTTFLDQLGFDLVVSPHSDREIVSLGLEGTLSEACFPVKVAIGHLRYLKDKGVDAIFLPSFVNLNGRNEEYPLGSTCPYAQSMPYVGRMAVAGIVTISPVVNMGRSQKSFERELKRSLRRYGVTSGEIRRAIAKAEQAQDGFSRALRNQGREILDSLDKKAIVIIGRPYNALEKGMNLRIPEKLAALGIMAMPMDMLDLEEEPILQDWPDMYWRSGQKILRAARIVRKHDNLYPIIIGNFSCGPDSFILKYLPEALGGKPFLHIEIDEHSADAGIITRCEAFLDSIEHRQNLPTQMNFAIGSSEIPSLAERTVYIPHMTDHAYALAEVFQRFGVASEVLPESDHRTTEISMKYVSGKECYPCHLTTGDMVKKVLASDFEPARSAFFMPSGSGPCRFGQYNVFHKKVLENLGLSDVPVFAPNQDRGLYEALGGVHKNFVLLAWKGIVAVDLLLKCLHETRPYELIPGASDLAYREGLRLIRTAIREGDDLEENLIAIRKRFENLPRRAERRPIIGVIGEVYVRLNRFANDDLIKKIESYGGEAWLTSFEEWISYLNAMSITSNLRSGRYGEAAQAGLKRLIQRRIERQYSGLFEGFLQTLHEPSTNRIFERAAPYIPHTLEGETVLSVGKSIDLAEKKVAGIVNAIPFGCMPGTIVAGIMQIVKRERDLPFITMSFDGTESATNAIQFEAFMDQAKTRSMNGHGRQRC